MSRRRVPTTKVGRCWRCRSRQVRVWFNRTARVFLCAHCRAELGYSTHVDISEQSTAYSPSPST